MTVEKTESKATTLNDAAAATDRSVPVLRCGITGMLLGLANLVPGVSGGTMVLVMGLYDEFISSVADATRLRFTRRSILFLAVLVGVAGVTIASLAGRLAELVTLYPLVMYALFAGMTLGGAPMLLRIMRPVKTPGFVAIVLGLVLMIAIGMGRSSHKPMTKAEKEAFKQAVRAGEYPLEPAMVTDAFAGVLGMSAMVLPGISGAYMLVLLGRYEQILASIDLLKDFVLSGGDRGSLDALRIIIPTGIGALISLIGLSNLLKWLLQRYEKPTVGFLLGIVLGSVVTLWPMMGPQSAADYGTVFGVLAAGFILTLGLSRFTGGSETHVNSQATKAMRA